MTNSSVPVLMSSNEEDPGRWISKKSFCKACQLQNIKEVHRYRHEGLSLREISAKIKQRWSEDVSFNTLSRHFRYHFLVNESRVAVISGNSQNEIVSTSIDTMISDLQHNRSTFFEAISSISKSQLEQLKQYQEYVEEIEGSLAELTPPGSDKSGFTNLDQGSAELIQRCNYFNEQIGTIQARLSKTFIDMQKVIAKSDDEVIKNHIFIVKKFLVQQLVSGLANLLNESVKEGIIEANSKVGLGTKIKDLLEKFEGELTIDYLYQQSIEHMRTNGEKQV